MQVAAAITLMIDILGEAQKIGALIQTAQANNQTELPADAWAQIISADDQAEGSLDALIKAAKGG